MKKPSLTFLIYASILIIFLEVYAFSWIAELVRQPSDSAVLVGLLLFAALMSVNVFLIDYLIKITKTKKPK